MVIFSIGKRFKNYIRLKIYSKKDDGINTDIYPSMKGTWINPDIQKLYYPNKSIKAELCYKNGVLDGIATLYYENGNIKAREYYSKNHLQGLSKWYYESGELKSEKYFREGMLLSTKEFDKKGNVISYTNH